MAKYGNDFSQYSNGQDLLTSADWEEVWGGSGYTWTAEDEAAAEDGGKVGRLDFVGTQKRIAIGWLTPGSLDGGVLFARWRITAQGGQDTLQQSIAVNQVQDNGENCLMMYFSTSDRDESVSIHEYTEGSYNENIVAPATFTFAEGTWVNVLWDFRAASFGVKVWTGDRYADEGTAVEITGTKPTAKTGTVGLNGFNDNVVQELDFIGLDDTDGDPPRSMADLSAIQLSNASASKDGTDGYSGSVDTDRNSGTLHHVVTTSSTKPSKTQVANGNDHNGSAAADAGDQTISSTGTKTVGNTGVLSAGTQYWIHYYHEDGSDESSVVTSGSFTTDAATVDAPSNAPVIQTPIETTTTTATVDYTFDDGANTGDTPTGYEYHLDGGSAVDIGDPDPKEFEIDSLTEDTAYNSPGVEVRAYNAGGSGPWSTAETFTTDEAGATLQITGDIDGGNLDSSTSSISDADTTTPEVTVRARSTDTDGSADRWKVCFFRLDNALNKRPNFEIDLSEYASTASDFRPWYTYDDPTSADASWTRWDSAPSNTSGDLWEFQLSGAFTQDTVYVSSLPAYPVAKDLSFIQAMKTANSERVHVLPSITDDANWSGGEVSEQTDEQGRTIPAQPMRGFGVWDGQVYPDSGTPKATVVMTAAVHAGEILGDWTCESAVRFLLSGDPVAERLLKNFQFFVYPNINPMGRWGGHDRAQWDSVNLTKDPNRDWQDNTLESTQLIKSMLDKDIGGRTVVLWLDFHSWAGTGGGRGNEPTFYLYQSQAQSAFVNTWQSAVAAQGDYEGQEFTTADSVTNYALANHGSRHAYVSEGKEYETHDSIDAWADSGEHWMKALDDINEGTDSSQVAFEGKYLALDFTGSGVGTAGRADVTAYDAPGGTQEKHESGLGVDVNGLWRADMNAVSSADVFVVISDDQYVTPENTRSHARRYTPSDTNG